jgi:hypothetical protein
LKSAAEAVLLDDVLLFLFLSIIMAATPASFNPTRIEK